jgi:hypothetical protein
MPRLKNKPPSYCFPPQASCQASSGLRASALLGPYGSRRATPLPPLIAECAVARPLAAIQLSCPQRFEPTCEQRAAGGVLGIARQYT